MSQFITHPFPPFYEPSSRILILGSFPSPKSRAMNFYYGHPQNRFWKIISNLYDKPFPVTVEERKELLSNCHIALYDTVYSCDIEGASDNSIKNVTVTNLSEIISNSEINHIFCNGSTAGKLYSRYHEKKLGISASVLPSTSPANAAWKTDRLIEAWSVIKE